MKQKTGKKSYYNGLICSLSCSVLWGVLPLYWQALRPISSSVIIFYRIFLVGVVCFFAALKIYGIEGIKAPLREKGAVWRHFAAGVLITANWSIYIWAVNANHVIQTCIGYYIEPLMVCVFGILFFKEKLTRHRLIAFILACGGVVMILVHFMEVPIIALGLALTFAVYAAMKKNVHLPVLLSLLYETMILSPIALAVLIYLETTGRGAWGHGQPYQYVMLLLVGFCTAIPLGLFSEAAKKLPMVTLGILEYVSPSIALILGIFFLGEPFDAVQFAAFAVIWVGLAVFTAGEYRETKKNEVNAMNETSDFFNVFGKDYDRFAFPKGIVRVTAGRGGEAILLCGSEKTALLDCGMAYCGRRMAENLKEALAGRPLDYILLSHSHYDHIGALPYVRELFPRAAVLGAKHTEKILLRPGAQKLMKELGESARDEYEPGSDTEIRVDHLSVDKVIQDGDRVSLGDRELLVLETKGHTDCSLSFVLEPDSILFASESTGILERLDYVHTPILKSYEDAVKSLDKCRSYGARRVILPHFGILPEDFNETYWQLYERELQDKRRYLASLAAQELSEEEIFQQYLTKYWTPAKAQEQPYEAFMINSRHIVHALLQSLDKETDFQD